MEFADALGQVSLGLVAICYLMWTTITWAFLEFLEKEENDEKYKAAKACLEAAANEFFVASGLFLTSTIVWIGQTIDKNLTVTQPLFLATGAVMLIIATLDTYNVISFRFDPTEKVRPITQIIKLHYSPFNLGVVGVGIQDALFVWYVYSWATRPSTIILLSFSILGVISMVILIPSIIKKKDLKWKVRFYKKDRVLDLKSFGGFMVILPWLLWLGFLIGKSIGFWG